MTTASDRIRTYLVRSVLDDRQRGQLIRALTSHFEGNDSLSADGLDEIIDSVIHTEDQEGEEGDGATEAETELRMPGTPAEFVDYYIGFDLVGLGAKGTARCRWGKCTWFTSGAGNTMQIEATIHAASHLNGSAPQ